MGVFYGLREEGWAEKVYVTCWEKLEKNIIDKQNWAHNYVQ
jgi:hypothetical protein